ncbi:MAG TPA: bifunctional cytidylyltransferase/SDR family oxidoreductase [Flavobacteriaceae bacterium]|nr:bifunctional cytidylyltransferase/SDR family oxidoreductase [Flavobacteriaceae bacterium]
MSNTIAIILAGGFATRMGLELPKQFLKVAGKSVLEHSVAAFEKHPLIDEIAIVCQSTYIPLVEEYVTKNKWTKVKKILHGGEKRYHSSLSAIKAYQQQTDTNLLFHDAVRPLVSQRIITDTIDALANYEAVDTAIPAVDTIIELEEDLELIDNIPERKYFWLGQTPQAFKLEIIKEAYDLAFKDPDFKATDDCGVVKKYLPETDIYVVKGDQQNIKLTYKEDIYLLDKLFQLKTTDIHHRSDLSDLSKKVIVVFGGREGIGAQIVEICKTENIKVYPFSRGLNQVDVTQEASVKKALQEVYDKEGKIDAVFNTAGLLSKEPLNNMSVLQIDKIIDVNLNGVIHVARAAYPYLLESKGDLVFYTSSSYTRGRPNYSVYSATKAAIVNFVQAVAAEWDADGIRVNCINPERTKTGMRTSNFGEEPDDNLLCPKNVAHISLSTLCTNLNGQVIDIKVKELE